MQEKALLLGPYKTNTGVLTSALNSMESHAGTALLCVTAGLLHHVGPHRLYVLLARTLAEQGISTLRFDFSGIGDSAVRPDDVPAVEVPIREIHEAIAELEKRGFTRFIIFGICSGAVQALKAAHGNPKIAGLILLNIGTDPANTEINPQIAAQYYLKRSFWNPHAWKNLFTGKVKYRQLFFTLFSAVVHRIKGKEENETSIKDSFQRGLQPLMEQGTSVLMVLSDRHAQFYELHRNAFETLNGEYFETMVFSEADHLFSSLKVQQDLIKHICNWTNGLINNCTSSSMQEKI